MENEKEHSKFLIQRFDNYINGVNTKGNFLLVFNSFFVGLLTANYNVIVAKINMVNAIIFFKVFFVLFIVASVLAIISIFRAVYPFLKSGNSSKSKYHSLIFFNSISEFKDEDEFCGNYQKQTNDEVEKDLAIQAYQLSNGLKFKFKMISNSMIFIYSELFFVTIMFLITLFF